MADGRGERREMRRSGNSEAWVWRAREMRGTVTRDGRKKQRSRWARSKRRHKGQSGAGTGGRSRSKR